MFYIIQDVQKQKGIHSRREALLNKHKNRETLTEEEMWFLAATSELLNNNIDKVYVQKVVDQVDSEIIDDIELTIAEEIITKYKTAVNQAKIKRNEYLNSKLLRKKQKFPPKISLSMADQKKKFHESLMKNRIIGLLLEGKEGNKINLHVTKLQRLRCQFAKSLENKIETGADLKLAFPNNQSKRILQQKEKQLKSQQVLYSLPKGQSITIGESQRKFHPSSKLILNLEALELLTPRLASEKDTPKFTQQDIMRILNQKKNMDQNRLKMNSETLPENFKRFYSSGPILKNTQTNNKQQQCSLNNWITDEIKEQAAIIIQKCARMSILKKKYENIKEEKLAEKANQRHRAFLDQPNSPIHKSIQQCILEMQLISFILKENHEEKSQFASIKLNSSINSGSLTPRDCKMLLESNFKYKQQLRDHILEQKSGQVSNKNKEEKSCDDSNNLICLEQNNSNSPENSTRLYSMTQEIKFEQDNMEVKSNTFNSINSECENFSSFTSKMIDSVNPRSRKLKTQNSQFSCHLSHQNSCFARQKSEIIQNEPQQQQKQIEILDHCIMAQSINASTKNNVFPLQNKSDIIIKSQKKQQISVHQRLFSSKKQIVPTSEEQEQKRQKHLELLREKMYQNSLLVKQMKLLSAAVHNNFQSLKSSGFILNKNDVNVKDKKGNTALYYAVKHKNNEFVQYLLKIGSNVNEKCHEGNSPLHLAFEIGDEQMIMDFMDNQGDLNSLNNDFQTPLAMAKHSFIKKMKLERGTARYVGENGGNAKQQSMIASKVKDEEVMFEKERKHKFDNNALFKKTYKKDVEEIELKDSVLQQQKKQITFCDQLIKDIQKVEEQQGVTFEIKIF